MTNPAALPLALPDNAFDAEHVWSLLLTLAQHARERDPIVRATGFALSREGWRLVPIEDALCIIDPCATTGKQVEVRRYVKTGPEVRSMFELYLPLVVGPRSPELSVGHLGSGLDGRIASTGDSQLLSGREDAVHTHRMRALFDAVVVGVRTVLLDDPQLTTRLVPGPHPTRVILDPQGRLPSAARVLNDGVSPTLVCVDAALMREHTRRGQADYVGIPVGPDGFDPRALFQVLRTLRLGRIFVEGGSITVSKLLAAGALDRVQVTVAPMILGSGAPALALPPIDRLQEAFSPGCRHFSLGPDTLFDCDLLAAPRAASA